MQLATLRAMQRRCLKCCHQATCRSTTAVLVLLILLVLLLQSQSIWHSCMGFFLASFTT
jgi:hypothetical protein